MSKPSLNMKQIGKRSEPYQADAQYRSFEVRASSLNEESRTIDADISTETPVPMPDWKRMEMIPEVLLANGVQFPKSRQVPFLDSHNRFRVEDQLGSAREIRVEGDKVRGTLHFSSAAQNEFTKVREGHVTDVSAGYEVLKRVFIPAGETKSISGRSFEGPVNVVTKWRLREVSLTPIGADAQAKLRGLDPAAFVFESRNERQFEMNEDLRKLLVSRCMPAELNDDDAQRWLLANPGKLADEKKEQQKEEQQKEEQRQAAPVIPQANPESVRRAVAEVMEAERKAQQAFRKEVDALCDLAGLPECVEHARGLDSVEAVRTYLQEQKRKIVDDIASGPSVRITSEGIDRLRSDIGTSLSLRCVESIAGRKESVDRIFPEAKRAKGHEQWRHASLYDMAHELVRASGVNTRGMTRDDVAICAMFGSEKIGVRSGGAYHTTGSFANLTLDAVNKSMQVGYTETPSTWRGPMRQGTSVNDFKNIHRIRMGSVGNLPVWNDNDNPEKAGVTDGKETYAVESRSIELNFSYRLLVNDDMDALTRAPQMLGAAAARTVNAVAWSQVTSNPTMSDSVALFAAATGARKRTNLTTGAGAPSTTTLQTLSNLMRQMRGENTPEGNESADILNLLPRYIIGPSALETTIKQLVLSVYDPGSANMAYNTASTLIPVIEPLLDAASTTAWYVFADPSQIDTVEVTFLAGQEAPVVRQDMDFKKLSQSFIVLQTFAAKALNHRGVQRHAGA